VADKAILYDASRCTACRGCQAACKEWNENDETIPTKENSVKAQNRGSYENPPDLGPSTWLKIKFTEVEHYNKLDWLFTRRACMHCTDAACVKVCPSHALYYDAAYGIVGFNKSLCTGCGYCVEFCPFSVPKLDHYIGIEKAKVSKCVFCTQPGLNRLDAGQTPACVKSCPPKALLYDDRSALITVGKQKVQTLQAAGFAGANLYGEKELGGLHVLYVLNDTPDKYGLPVNPPFPDVATAWKDIIQPVGWAVGGLTILGLVLNFIVAREAKMTQELPGRGKKEAKHGGKK
jgi:formate dehydrogenase beta subunit